MEKSSSAHQETPTLNRFDNVLKQILADGQTQNGLVVLPERDVLIGETPTLVRFFAYDPKPLEYEFGSEYSPGIYCEIGSRDYTDNGKPIGEVNTVYIRRSHLEPVNGTTHEKKALVDKNLESIEELLFAYKNFTPLRVV